MNKYIKYWFVGNDICDTIGLWKGYIGALVLASIIFLNLSNMGTMK